MSTETAVTINDYFDRVNRALIRHGDWRVGQAYYNVLFELRPDLARQVDERPDVDPFHDDARMTAFVAFLRGAWAGVTPETRT